MNHYLVNIAFFLALALVVIGAVIAWRRSTDPVANRDIVMTWFKHMDLVTAGQRYKGERCEIVCDLGSGRRGSAGWELFAACRTLSGRKFFIRVLSIHRLVVDWEIAAATDEEFDQLLIEEAQPNDT